MAQQKRVCRGPHPPTPAPDPSTHRLTPAPHPPPASPLSPPWTPPPRGAPCRPPPRPWSPAQGGGGVGVRCVSTARGGGRWSPVARFASTCRLPYQARSLLESKQVQALAPQTARPTCLWSQHTRNLLLSPSIHHSPTKLCGKRGPPHAHLGVEFELHALLLQDPLERPAHLSILWSRWQESQVGLARSLRA